MLLCIVFIFLRVRLVDFARARAKLKSVLKESPGTAIVGYAVTLRVRGIVGYLLATIHFALLGVDGVDVGGFRAFVGHVVFAEVATDGFPFLALAAYTVESLGTGEDDVALGIIPGVVLVLLEHWELDGIDKLQVF